MTLTQQAPQHLDRAEHLVFLAFADPDDGHLARLLSRPGQRRVGAAAGGAAPCLSHLLAAVVLPGENQGDPWRGVGSPGLVVRWNL